MCLDGFALCERLDARVAVGSQEDADRDLEFLVEFVGKGECQS
jgi:hypothetical protein